MDSDRERASCRNDSNRGHHWRNLDIHISAMSRFAISGRAFIRAVLRFGRWAGNAESAHFRSRERFRRIALTGATSLGSRAITVATSLISIPLTYRYLGAERYGIWMVLTSMIGAMTFADLGIGNGLVNAISDAHGRDDRDLACRCLTSGCTLLLCIAGIVCTIGLASYPFVPWTRVFNVRSAVVAAEGARAFLVLFLWFIASIPLGVVARAQSGFQEAYWPQAIAAVGSVFSLGALVAAVTVRGSLPLLVFSTTSGSILGVVVNGWVLFRRRPWLLPRPGAFDFGATKLILRLGIMFFVLQVAATLAYNSDNIVITQILGAAAVGVYAVPQKLFCIISILVGIGLGPICPAYCEAFARGDLDWVRRTFWGSLRWTMSTITPICVLLVLAGPFIVRVAMGRVLQIPISVFVVLGIWAAVSTASNVMSVLLNGAGVLKGQTIIAIIAGSSNLALSIFLTGRFGVVGVCLGSIISQLAIIMPSYTFLVKGLLSRMSETTPKQPRVFA
jgi:O-antigen/teichoic acid export membrane protein